MTTPDQITELSDLLYKHTWGCGHCGGCACDSDEAADETGTSWATHVAKVLVESGYTKVDNP